MISYINYNIVAGCGESDFWRFSQITYWQEQYCVLQLEGEVWKKIFQAVTDDCQDNGETR